MRARRAAPRGWKNLQRVAQDRADGVRPRGFRQPVPRHVRRAALNVGIVAAGFAPGGTGGTETYFRTLVSALQSNDRSNAYTIFLRPELKAELPLSAPNFTAAPLRERAPLLRRIASHVMRRPQPGGRVHDVRMAQAIDARGLDVAHFPLQVLNPWGVRANKVLSFMDMQHEFFPEFFTPEKLRLRRETYRPSVEAADHVIAISEYTRRTIIERYGLSPDRVTTVHLAYDEALFAASLASRPSDFSAPAGPYFFYPAGAWPHKNHDRLLAAFARVNAARPEFTLLLTGLGVRDDATITARIRSLKLQDAVTVLGYLPYHQLPAVYRGAYALVYPSLFEGFGIPLCEAMATGCPIVASNTTSIPEVAGAAAIYFDPTDSDAIADAMLHLIDHPEERPALAAAGAIQGKRYSPSLMARQTVAVYERVAAVRRRES